MVPARSPPPTFGIPSGAERRKCSGDGTQIELINLE